jgi:hypothetical protein
MSAMKRTSLTRGLSPTAVRDALRCTATELDRWASDGRLPPDGERFYLGVGLWAGVAGVVHGCQRRSRLRRNPLARGALRIAHEDSCAADRHAQGGRPAPPTGRLFFHRGQAAFLRPPFMLYGAGSGTSPSYSLGG